jgi:hypothetical protein
MKNTESETISTRKSPVLDLYIRRLEQNMFIVFTRKVII